MSGVFVSKNPIVSRDPFGHNKQPFCVPAIGALSLHHFYTVSLCLVWRQQGIYESKEPRGVAAMTLL